MSSKTLPARKSLDGLLKPLTNARRAYIGLHGVAYSCAQMRREKAQTFVKTQFDTFVSKGEVVEEHVTDMAGNVKADVAEKLRFPNPAALLKKSRKNSSHTVAELEAQVEKLNAQLEKMAKDAVKKNKPKKKVATQKTVTKKAATKTVTTEKVSTAKLAENTETSIVKTDVTTETKSEVQSDKYAPYVADVQRYDAAADASIVRKIVIHCGIALRNNDGRFVACSDETERQTVRNSWLIRKLGVDGETAVLDAKVQAVCEVMKADNKKNRVTFYYLLAKNEGKLTSL